MKLAATDLMSLEQYARERAAFRTRVIEHKRARQLQVGPNTTWSFEDRLTIQYQIQEMLRVERIFEPEGIAEELASYNPLIPDGRNWKATCLVEYEDPVERARQLVELKGIERMIWLRIGDHGHITPIADEDLERENEEKTSAVHFLRFEIPEAAVAELRRGAGLAFGVEHPSYRHQVIVAAPVRDSLLQDLDQ